MTNNKGDVYGRRIVTNSSSKLKSTSGELIDVKGVAHVFIKSCRFSDKLTHFVVVICLRALVLGTPARTILLVKVVLLLKVFAVCVLMDLTVRYVTKVILVFNVRSQPSQFVKILIRC